VGDERIRVLSDLHYGDRLSAVRSLSQIKPLKDGASALILNGDTLDTRPGPDPSGTAAAEAEVRAFFAAEAPPSTFLTGNHDPHLSEHHSMDLAGGKIFLTHGDILYESIVPWGRDARVSRERITSAFASLPDGGRRLEDRLAALRTVAASIHQRHQSERNFLRYFGRLALDTIWPPHRAWIILNAWRELPSRAARLASIDRPGAQFMLVGHTHRPGVWRRGPLTVINTGSFCPPLGGMAVDIEPSLVRVRKILPKPDAFRLGPTVAEFRLSGA